MSVELKSGYFNAVFDASGTPDITYSAEELNEFLEGLIPKNGIFHIKQSSNCRVDASDGLNVLVNSGKGQVNNHWFKVVGSAKLELSPADTILDRKDRIIVRCDEESRKCILMVLEGELSYAPQAPAIGDNDISLATVLIKSNAKKITTSNITDERSNTDVCGWITGLIDQVDTSDLFNQYQAALNEFLEIQNEFVNEKTAEYENWFNNTQDEVEEWFGNVKDEVKATSLYREYEAVYTTVSANEQVITIPTSINYVHNGLDILNVHIDGKHLIEGKHFEITGTTIILNDVLASNSIGTELIFVNKKSVDGTAVEGAEVQIEALQEQVNNLTISTIDHNYYATGSNDNITISNLVKSFLDGTGDYSSVKDYASMYLHINGEVGIESLIESQMAFDFHNSVDSNRKVYVDFGNATINFSQMDSGGSIIAIFGSNNNVVIEKANIYIRGKGAATFYVFHGGIIKDCVVDIDDYSTGLITTLYGVWNGGEVSNSKFNLKPKNACYGIYECERVQFNDILTANGVGYCAIKSSDGFVIGNSINYRLCTVDISDSVVKLANKGF